MLVSEIKLSNWISIAAFVAAAFSAFVACASYRLAKRSYALAAHTSDLSKPNLALYLIDAFRYRLKGRDRTLYVFCVSIENKSIIQNSIVNVEMRLPFIRDGVERLAVFEHSNNLTQSYNLDIKNTIQLPAAILMRGALVVNCCFEVPNEMLERAEFDLHILRFKCAEGPFSELRPKVIMDVMDVQDLEKKRNTGIPFDPKSIVPIVADAAIASGAVGDGRLIPLVILDTTNRPDLVDLFTAHDKMLPGDADLLGPR